MKIDTRVRLKPSNDRDEFELDRARSQNNIAENSFALGHETHIRLHFNIGPNMNACTCIQQEDENLTRITECARLSPTIYSVVYIIMHFLINR